MFYCLKVPQVNIYSFAKVSFEMVRISSFLRSRSGKKEDEYARAQLLGVGVLYS